VKQPGGYLARFSMEAHAGVGFVDLAPGTDLRLLDVTLTRAGQPPRQVEFLWVFAHHDLDAFRKEDAKSLAERDFNSLLASGLLARAGSNPLDLALDHLERALDTLRKTLEEPGPRDELPTLLLDHPFLLDASTEQAVRDLPAPLDGLDAALALRDGGYRLVNLRSPGARLFLPTGFTSDAEKAIEEAGAARAWVRENLAQARRFLPNVVDPSAIVVMGRKHDLSVEDVKRLQQWNAAHPEVRLHTYDDLYESALLLRANLLRALAAAFPR